MSVTLLDLFLSKKLIGFGDFGQHTRIASKTKGSAKVFHIFLIRHQSNDRMRGLRCQLNAVGIFISKYVAGKFYNSHLHSKAQPEEGHLVGPEAVTNGEASWLNVWSAERLRRWPDAPTLRELGYRLVVTAPFGIVGPPNLPPDYRAGIHDAVLATMRDEPFRQLLERQDMTEDYRDGPAYAAFIAESARTEEMLIGRLGLLP